MRRFRVVVALALALALAACSKPSTEPAPGSASAAASGSSELGSAHDLLVTPSLRKSAALAPASPFVQELAVWSPSTVTVSLTHARGALGPFTLGIYDTRAPNAPLGRDSMTCAEPGCTIKAEVDIGPGTTKLVIRAEAEQPLEVTLEVAAAARQ